MSLFLYSKPKSITLYYKNKIKVLYKFRLNVNVKQDKKKPKNIYVNC